MRAGASASTGRCCAGARCTRGGARRWRRASWSLASGAARAAPGLASSCRGCARAPIVINTVRLAGRRLDESVRYGTPDRAGCCSQTFPDEIEHVWTPHRHGRGRHRPDGRRAVRRLHHAARRASSGSARSTQDELVDADAAELCATCPGMRMAVHAADRDARERDDRRRPQPTSASSSSATTSTLLKAKAREIEAVLRAIPGAADVTRRAGDRPAGAPRSTVDRAAIARHGIAGARRCSTWSRRWAAATVGEVQEGERPLPARACACRTSYRDDPDAARGDPGRRPPAASASRSARLADDP